MVKSIKIQVGRMGDACVQIDDRYPFMVRNQDHRAERMIEAIVRICEAQLRSKQQFLIPEEFIDTARRRLNF